jgi:outer membrane protein assembly factor BamB
MRTSNKILALLFMAIPMAIGLPLMVLADTISNSASDSSLQVKEVWSKEFKNQESLWNAVPIVMKAVSLGKNTNRSIESFLKSFISPKDKFPNQKDEKIFLEGEREVKQKSERICIESWNKEYYALVYITERDYGDELAVKSKIVYYSADGIELWEADLPEGFYLDRHKTRISDYGDYIYILLGFWEDEKFIVYDKQGTKLLELSGTSFSFRRSENGRYLLISQLSVDGYDISLIDLYQPMTLVHLSIDDFLISDVSNNGVFAIKSSDGTCFRLHNSNGTLLWEYKFEKQVPNTFICLSKDGKYALIYSIERFLLFQTSTSGVILEQIGDFNISGRNIIEHFGWVGIDPRQKYLVIRSRELNPGKNNILFVQEINGSRFGYKKYEKLILARDGIFSEYGSYFMLIGPKTLELFQIEQP